MRKERCWWRQNLTEDGQNTLNYLKIGTEKRKSRWEKKGKVSDKRWNDRGEGLKNEER